MRFAKDSKPKYSCGDAASYGDRAHDITRIAEQRNLGRRLVRGHPVLEAEVVYAVHHEYCETPEDFIARRSRLAFLDHRACEEALPKVSFPCSFSTSADKTRHDSFQDFRTSANDCILCQLAHILLNVCLLYSVAQLMFKRRGLFLAHACGQAAWLTVHR